MHLLAGIWVAVMFVCGLTDLITTAMIVRKGGVELNPAAAALFGFMGPWASAVFAIAKISVIAGFVFLLFWLPKTGWFESMEKWGQNVSMAGIWFAAALVFFLAVAAVFNNINELLVKSGA